jgi:hypothetical protein
MDCQGKKGLQKQKDVFEKGKDFVLVGESVDVTQNFTRIEFEDWVRTAAGIDNKEIVADLADLVEKHPEFYKRKSDVYRMILEVKNEPQFFLKNNNEKLALIVSKLKNGKLGKLGVEKNGVEVNQIRHAAMSSKTDKDLARLKKRQAVGSPTPTLPTHEAKSSLGTTAGADAHSPASTKEIIAQKKSYSQKVDSFFKKAEEIIGAVDEAITTKATGGWAKRTLTVSELTKKIGEVTHDFRVAQSQIHEQAAQIKEFLDMHLSPDESTMMHQALTGDMEATKLPQNLRDTYKKMRDIIDKNADALVEAGALAEKNKIKDYLKRYYEDHLKEGGLIKKFYFDQRFKARKELTHDERIAAGMIEDANFVIPKTLAEQRVQLLKAQTLKNIADTFASSEAKDGFVHMSDESVGGGIKKYGALAGKYVPKEVADAIKHAGLVKENMGMLENIWYPLVDHIKVNLTVKNPFTHVYNIGSNIMLSFLHGDVTALAKVVNMAVHDKKRFDVLVKRANKYGLNSSLDMFEKMEPFSDKKEPLVMTILKNAYFAKGSKSGDFARHAYEWEDKIFKIASFYRHLSEGMDEKSAFKISQRSYVDYTTPIPGALRVLDKMGIMPFVHYTYKATPMVLEAIAKNPTRFAIMQAALLGTGASAWLGDNEKANAYKPSWAASSWMANAFGLKSWVQLGGGWYLNAGRLVPGMRFDGFDSLEFSGGFAGGMYRIANGETPLGYNIDGKYDSTSTKIAKRVLAMAENYLPPMTFGRYGQRVLGKATGLKEPKNYYDEPMSYTEMITRGIGVRQFNEKKEVLSKVRALKNTLKHEKERAEDKKDPSILRAAQKEYKLKLDKLRKPARDVRLDLSKF